MERREFAENLINSQNSSERRSLLKENKALADAQLAWILKDICYESWSNEPTIAQETSSILKILADINLNQEIKAIYFWVTGIANITRGNIEQSIENLNQAAENFNHLQKKNEATQTQVAKLIPLALLGKYDEAIRIGENALKIFIQFGDKLAAGKVEMNLSNIVSRQGKHTQAINYCQSALQKFKDTNEKQWQTMAENGLANSYSELNDFRKAEKFYAAALKTARSAKMFVTEAEIEASLGNLATFRGNYSEALNYLEKSRRKFQELKMPHQKVIADLEIAEIYQTLNLTEEAFEIYSKISKSFKKLKLQGEEAKTRKNFGKVSIKKGDFKKAYQELEKSAKLYLAEKNLSGAAGVKLSEAKLKLITADYLEALQIVNEAKRLLRKSENLRLKLQADFLHGDILRKLDKEKASEKMLTATYRTALENEQKMLAQNCLNSLGKLALKKGEINKAKNYFKQSIKIIENQRSPLPAEEFRMAFLADNLLPFENLAKIYITREEIEKAFIFNEKAKSRSLADAIGAIENKISKTTPQDTELEIELKNLREELNWFYSRLSRVEESEIEQIQMEITRYEQKITEKMRQIGSTKQAGFGDETEQISIPKLKKSLGKDQALIEFIKFGEDISAFVITDNKLTFFKDLTKESEIISILKGLHFQFGALRYGKQFAEKYAIELKKRTDFYLEKLYEQLLAPLEDSIGNRDLVIIPVSTLFYIPFCGLFDGERYVIEDRQIVTSPSASVWNLLQSKPRKTNLEKPLLIGFADKHIPLVDQEIRTLQKILPTSKTFLGKDATVKNYIENAEEKDILHLACHGQFRPDNPLFSSLHLADGFVTVRDICSQNLNAELVTLSACETGLNKIHKGEEILGLARGFLTAGVQTLVLSLWTVNDSATQDLMKFFYTNLQLRHSIAASLQRAQKSFIKSGKHPYFWVSFGIIGK